MEKMQITLETQFRCMAPISNYRAITDRQPELPYGYVKPCVSHGVSISLEKKRARLEAYLVLTEMEKFTLNWDGYGANPIGKSCIANARSVLGALHSWIPSPDIIPNPNGTLTLDWETEEQFLSLEVGATRFSTFWESKNGSKTDEGILEVREKAIPSFVTKALASLFPHHTASPVIGRFANPPYLSFY
jgi:hypothetical protein